MEDYEKKYEPGSIVTAKRTYNGEQSQGNLTVFIYWINQPKINSGDCPY